jgi:hypothetical protein
MMGTFNSSSLTENSIVDESVLKVTPTDPKQTLLLFLPDGSLSAKHRTRDYGTVNFKRGRLSEMVLLDKLPFKFVERPGFRRFVQSLAPQWHVPGRKTVTNDIEKTVFPQLKLCIREGLRVDTDSDTAYSLTTDTWKLHHWIRTYNFSP